MFEIRVLKNEKTASLPTSSADVGEARGEGAVSSSVG